MVAEPPRFAQNTSESIMGIGLNFRSCASSTVTAARNRITVILSMNIESIADISMNVTNSLVLYSLGERHAQPAEESCLSHALDHYHHSCDKDDGRPVDTAGAFL